MKKNDILIIAVVAIVAGVFSFILANFLFGGDKKFNLDAPTVQPITAEFKTPDSQVFQQRFIRHY
jgi:hypothetical protein